jgi:arylsulfatase A-like enzyme
MKERAIKSVTNRRVRKPSGATASAPVQAVLRAAALSCLLLSCLSVRAAARPNVLIILTDDQGYGDLSLHGNPHIRTPHIDTLGSSGVRFDRFYVSSVCAPTRAALLTGRWPLRTGCHGVTRLRETMRSEELTLAEAFASAGYRTACFGKWHNGAHYPFSPQGQGFETFFGFTAGHWNDYFNATLLRGAAPERTHGYITDVLTDEAIRYIEPPDQPPFFCLLAYNAPHDPYQVPEPYFKRFKQAGFDDRTAAFWGMVENLDHNIGRLLQSMEQRRLRDNTIIIFMTDNGGTAGVKHYNAGMRGGKTSVHEGGSRVPLFIHWPAAGWRPRIVENLTAHVDLYPTLLDICAIPPPAGPKPDGISLRPLLEGRDGFPQNRTLFIHNGIDETNKWPGAVRTPRYRLVRKIKGPAAGSSALNADHTVGAWQLYDMLSDPGESVDIAARSPDVVRELAQRYDQWFADISTPPPVRPPIPVGHDCHNPVALSAHHAVRVAPPLRYASGGGFAHDWLTDWTNTNGRIEFEIDVARSGDFTAEIAYSCPPQSAGSKIRISAGESTLEARVAAAPAREIELPHRDELGPKRYRNRDWAVLEAGTMRLPAGRATLSVRCLDMPGGEVMDFKELRLTRLNRE